LRRLLFNLLALGSLVLVLLAGLAWGLSYGRPLDWYALRTEHHPSWLPGETSDGRRPAGIIARKTDPSLPQGYWRAWWLRSLDGRITLLHQDAGVGALGGALTDPPTRLYVLGYVASGSLQRQQRGNMESLAAFVIVREPAVQPFHWYERWGFSWVRTTSTRPNAIPGVYARAWAVTIPHWLLIVLGLPLPLLWFWNRRQSKRWAKAGLCIGCGYDLRASPGRCPECGQEPSS
jgi:hypothetical protein